MHNTSQIAFIDTETTGLDPERHRVWEIAVIVDGEEHVWQQDIGIRAPYEGYGGRWGDRQFANEDSMWEWLAERDIVSPWVLGNTGIRERYDRTQALSVHASIEQLARLVSGRHLVGACPWFDSERLHRVQLAECDHRALLWHYHLIDVETLAIGWLAARGITPELPWNSEILSQMVGVEPPSEADRHSALGDARWARDIYEAVFGLFDDDPENR